MSYGRMKEERLKVEVDELLRRAKDVDEEEDRRYGRDKRGDELPEELAFRGGWLRKIREAKAVLEAGAKAEKAESEARNHPGVPETGRSGTSPIPTPGSCRYRKAGTSGSPTTARRWWTATAR